MMEGYCLVQKGNNNDKKEARRNDDGKIQRGGEERRKCHRDTESTVSTQPKSRKMLVTWLARFPFAPVIF